jgi:hypothetical protein
LKFNKQNTYVLHSASSVAINVIMASAPTDQSAILKEVLDTLKSLQINQTALASHVDAIAGRVNVLAGMKEVRDVALAADSSSVNQNESNEAAAVAPLDDSHHDHDVVPPSPSLPATAFQVDGAGSQQISHARKPSVTSRIILT